MCQPGPSLPPAASVATPKSASCAAPVQIERQRLIIAGREQPYPVPSLELPCTRHWQSGSDFWLMHWWGSCGLWMRMRTISP